MILSFEMPDRIARDLHLDGENGRRRLLEMVALEGYRAGELSRGRVGELLHLGFHETEKFLHDHNAEIELTMDEFEESATRLEQLLAK